MSRWAWTHWEFPAPTSEPFPGQAVCRILTSPGILPLPVRRFGYSYPPLEYKDPVFEYAANVTKIKGSHNIRFGEDIVRLHMNHKEVRNTVFQFTGGVTSIPGGAPPNQYNGVADFLLGLPQTTNNWFQPEQPYITLRRVRLFLLCARSVAGKP